MRTDEEVKKKTVNEFSVKDSEVINNPTSKQLPYTIDDEGRRIFEIKGIGHFYRTKEGRTGDLVLDGSKIYEIQKDGSFKRMDKKRRKR